MAWTRDDASYVAERMLRELLRFNALATSLAQAGQERALAQPLGAFLDQHRFSESFRDWYLLPMLGCIWSCPTQQMLAFPVSTLIRFCHNHGLLQVADRPQWWTVQGGARHYVDKIVARVADKRLDTPVLRVERSAAGVRLFTQQGGWERFDKLVLVAAPKTLGDLRDLLPDPVKAKVVAEIDKDLTKVPLHELPKHLDSVLKL